VTIIHSRPTRHVEADAETTTGAPGEDSSLRTRPMPALGLPQSVRWVGAAAIFAVAVISVRQSFGNDPDFRTSVWDAGRSMLRGSDPYNVAEFHRLFPGQGWMPIYGPPHLWLAVVMALLPVGVATALWFVFNLAGMIAIATVAVRSFGRNLGVPAVLTVTGILILSRGGRGSFHQVTVLYVLAAYVAWSQVRTRPMLAACALALALGKPPFGLPLLALFAICGFWRVITRALGLFAVACIPILLWLSADEGSPAAVWRAVTGNLKYSDNTAVDRVGAVRRIDAVSLIGRYVHGIGGGWEVAAFVVFVGSVGIVLRRRSTRGWVLTPAMLLTLALVTLLSIAHQDYDLLLLAWPFVAACNVVWPAQGSGRRRRDWVLFLVMAPALATSCMPGAVTAKLLSFGSDVGVISTLTTACLFLALVGAATIVLVEAQSRETFSTTATAEDRGPVPSVDEERPLQEMLSRL
jgi:hypothetical protein